MKMQMFKNHETNFFIFEEKKTRRNVEKETK